LPEHRRQGLAAACTSTLCSLLLGEVNLVALSVREENQPARALYRKLGFVEHNVYFEAQATKH
jgi:predicted GNAT family acetyltransferase